MTVTWRFVEPCERRRPWWYPRFSEYYDINTSAVARNARKLGQLDAPELRVAIQDIQAGVLTHAQTFYDELLTKAAASVVE